MKVYDAVVVVRHKISSVATVRDLAVGLKFEDLVRDLVEAEGICNVADDEFEIVSIEQKERNE